METLKHENYSELMEFVASVYNEYIQPGSEVRRMLQVVGSPAPNAFQQCMMEVRPQDGGFGMSHMTAKDWFNSDEGDLYRPRWADEIAALYKLYTDVKKADEMAEANPVADELKAIREELATVKAKLAEAEKEMPAEMKKMMDAKKEEATEGEDDAEEETDEDKKSKKEE